MPKKIQGVWGIPNAPEVTIDWNKGDLQLEVYHVAADLRGAELSASEMRTHVFGKLSPADRLTADWVHTSFGAQAMSVISCLD
jgi:hypothetical protein